LGLARFWSGRSQSAEPVQVLFTQIAVAGLEVFVAAGLDELHLIAPLDFPLKPPPGGERVALTDVYEAVRSWLES